MDIYESRLQSVNDAYDNIVDAFDEIVDLINSNIVRTVYGWGKRGFINDVSLLGNYIKETGDNKILSQDISTDGVHLHPPKKDFLDLSRIHCRSIYNLKFSFSIL